MSAKGKGIATNAFGIDTESNTWNTTESSNSGPNLTKDQYGQLLNLLQHFQLGSAGEAAEDQLMSGAANFAGMIACNSSVDFDKLSCRCFKSKTDLWILDSGATHHMTYNKTHLSDIILLPYPLLVSLPNGYKVKVTEVGNVNLISKITLHKVLFIPSFKYNLISIKSLALYLKCLFFSLIPFVYCRALQWRGLWKLVEYKMDFIYFAQPEKRLLQHFFENLKSMC